MDGKICFVLKGALKVVLAWWVTVTLCLVSTTSGAPELDREAQIKEGIEKGILPYVVPEDLRKHISSSEEEYFEANVRLNSSGEGGSDFSAVFGRLKKKAPTATLMDAGESWIRIRVSGNDLEALVKASFQVYQITLIGMKTDGFQTFAEEPVIIRDTDGDGLTDTEEWWWGTNPENPDTDGDGFDDGTEIKLARSGDHSAGIPWPDWPVWGERPNHPGNVGWGWGDGTEPPIIDLDQDSIPDAAERFVLGFNPHFESTDHDRYDDGMEFWGITQLGRGALPRAVDSDFLLGEMPGFVDPPGSSPLATAYPDIKIQIFGETIKVTRLERITTENREITEEEFTYIHEVVETDSLTSGSSVTQSVFEREVLGQAGSPPEKMDFVATVENPSSESPSSRPESGERRYTELITPFIQIGASGAELCYETAAVSFLEESGVSLNECRDLFDSIGVAKENKKAAEVGSKVGNVVTGAGALLTLSVAGSPLGLAAMTTGALISGFSAGFDLWRGHQLAKLTSNPLFKSCDTIGFRVADDFSVVVPTSCNSESTSQPLGANTFTGITKKSSTTVTRNSVRQMHSRSVTNRTEERVMTRSEWAKATTVDTGHAADLSFDIEIANDGTDVIRSLTSIIISIFIGTTEDVGFSTDIIRDPDSTIGTITNLFPGSSFRINSPVKVPLTLDQMRRIDLGEPINIVLERIEYGDDQLFYENAYAGGVLFLLDNGVDDNEEELQPYLLPTWGDETYFNVLKRVTDVLVLNFDLENNLLSLDVPVFDSQHRIDRFKRFANKINASWVILAQTEDGLSFTEKPAVSETTVFIKYIKDEDRDGYSDSEEWSAGTNSKDAISFPTPDLKAAFHNRIDNEGKIYSLLAIENSGNFPATSVEARMYSSDGHLNIIKNFSGGGGIINPRQRVIVGPRFIGPNLDTWSSTSIPLLGGIFRGTEPETFTFSVPLNGDVGIASTVIDVSWGSDEMQTLNLGDDGGNLYNPPELLEIGDTGLMIGFTSGNLREGETFSVDVHPTVDAFKFSPLPIESIFGNTTFAGVKTTASTVFRTEFQFNQDGDIVTFPATGESDQLRNFDNTYEIIFEPTQFTDFNLLIDHGSRRRIYIRSTGVLWVGHVDGDRKSGLTVEVGNEYYLAISNRANALGNVETEVILINLTDGSPPEIWTDIHEGLSNTLLDSKVQLGKEIGQISIYEPFFGRVGFFQVWDHPFTADEMLILSEAVALPPSIQISYNSPRGHHRLAIANVIIDLEDVLDEDPLDAATNMSLGVLSLFDSSQSNIIHAKVFSVDEFIRDARLYLELIDPSLTSDNVLWSHTETKSLSRGLNYLNVVFDPTNDPVSGPLEEGKPFYLLATLTDANSLGETGLEIGGNIIDESMVAFAVIDSQASNLNVNLRLSQSEFNLPSSSIGSILSRSITVANTGTDVAEILFPASNDSIRTSLSGDFARLMPGRSVTFVISVDTLDLGEGNQEIIIPVRSNDPLLEVSDIRFSFDLFDDMNEHIIEQIDGFPWEFDIFLRGPLGVNETVFADLPVQYNFPEIFPVSLSHSGEIVGNGPYTNLRGKPWIVSNSLIRPRRIFIKVPEAVPSNSVSKYRLELGMKTRVTDDTGSIRFSLSRKELPLRSLAILPLNQQIRPFLLDGTTAVNGLSSRTDLAADGESFVRIEDDGSIFSGIFINVDPHARGGSEAYVTLAEDIRRLGIEEITFLYAGKVITEGNSETGRGLTVGIGDSIGKARAILPDDGEYTIRLEFDYGAEQCQLFVDDVFQEELDLGGIGEWFLEIQQYATATTADHLGVKSVQTEFRILSIIADGIDLLKSAQFTEISGGSIVHSQGGSSGILSSMRWIGPDHLGFTGISRVEFSGSTRSFHSISVPWESPLFSTVELYSDGLLLGGYSGIAELTVEDDIFSFDNVVVQIEPTALAVNIDGMEELSKTFMITQEMIEESERIPFINAPNGLLNDTAGESVEVLLNFSGVGTSGLEIGISGLSTITEGMADLTVESVELEEGPDGFPVGSSVQLEASIENFGPVSANYFTVSFYDGDPTIDGRYLTSVWVDQGVSAMDLETGNPGAILAQVDWAVNGAAGLHTIFAVVDPFNDIPEENENNNTASTVEEEQLFISYLDQISIDSGNEEGPEADVVYDPNRGYGYETGEAFTWGDGVNDTSLETVRFAFDGELVYRFDNVSPLFSYNLDISLFRPDGLPIEYQIIADNRVLKPFVADVEGGVRKEQETIELNQGVFGNSAFATAFIPADVLEDESVRIRVFSVGGVPASISHIQMQRGARIFIDSGGVGILPSGEPSDPEFGTFTDPETTIDYGYITEPPAEQSFSFIDGPSSLDSLRFSPAGKVGYKFSGLDPSLSYILRPTISGTPDRRYQFEITTEIPFETPISFGTPVEVTELPITHNLVLSSNQFNNVDNSFVFTVARVDDNGDPISGDTTITDLELSVFTGADQASSDFDSDGLPDWWELKFSKSDQKPLPDFSDASIDSDGDGMINKEEFAAGTDPSDISSRFHIKETVLEAENGIFEIRWDSSLGRVYSIEWTSSIGEAFELLAENISAHPTGENVYLFEVNGIDRAFFRIIAKRAVEL